MAGPPSRGSDRDHREEDILSGFTRRPGVRQLTLRESRSNSFSFADPDGNSEAEDGWPSLRPKTHAGSFRRPMLNLSSSLSSLNTTGHLVLDQQGGTPLPNREDFKVIRKKVEVIMFDFDGTLTSTPGDRQVRTKKRIELAERAPMLQARLKILRDFGCLLGIISKSTEMTIRDALEGAGLLYHFEAPIIGKAMGFEGKIGFIQDLARRGLLRKPGDRRPGPNFARILLVDDDVLELERASAGGLQTYAAPQTGGLQHADFDLIEASLKQPSALPADQEAAPSEGAL
eukprot:CAMPEP_0206432044 /NCGR_PEP_ID=MMETSP0324_2-20121206/7694_1 /ASSEMBLY_ACC=CAM_ASM_000836 /TAXON_ID=2866 /ORGANISM="Crypthecodinium cohnii, Strain Seligo" /LENGTH=286 /DNA_ID=CAMNT_0053898025 /DNA_START=44 /DNA_END=905 /DNA_ORIENTATION=+